MEKMLNNTTDIHNEPYKKDEERQAERLMVMLNKMADIFEKQLKVIEELNTYINHSSKQ